MKLAPPIARCEVDSLAVPWFEFPIWSANKAADKGNSKNILFRTWGGIGDVICSEPTVRYAVERFKDCKITVETNFPEVFQHLALADIYDTKKERAIADDYLVKETVPTQSVSLLLPQFFNHIHTHCVDFGSMCALRSQLPIANREVILRPPTPESDLLHELVEESHRYVAVHAGRHWPSKTFPAAWWNRTLDSIVKAGFTPILIGKDGGESQGYVAVNAEHCVDLRDKCSLNETMWLLQQLPILVCNDSSPLHMAVTGNAWIGFVPTVKHPDFITHFRQGKFGWRMQSFGKGGMWDHSEINPNVTIDVNLDHVDPELLKTFLPEPEIFGPWCKEKMDEYFQGI